MKRERKKLIAFIVTLALVLTSIVIPNGKASAAASKAVFNAADDQDYTLDVSDNAATLTLNGSWEGVKNLGFLQFDQSTEDFTANVSVTINEEYTFSLGSITCSGESWENGLPNAFWGSSEEVKSTDGAVLYKNMDDGKEVIELRVGGASEATTMTSITYNFTFTNWSEPTEEDLNATPTPEPTAKPEIPLAKGEYFKFVGSWVKGSRQKDVNYSILEDSGINFEDNSWQLCIHNLDLSVIDEPILEVTYEDHDDTLQVYYGDTDKPDGYWGDAAITDGVENSGFYELELDKSWTDLYITSNGSSLEVTQVRLYDAGAYVEPTQAPGTDATQAPGTDATQAPGGDDATQAPGTDATQAPGTDATQAPGTDATQAPGTDATQAPGTDATQAPDGNGGGSVQDPGTNQNPGTSTSVSVKKVTLQKAKSTKKKTVTVQWKKLSGVTGYEVQIATKKNFKKGLKKYTVKKAKTAKLTVKKLKSKTKYFVRVRAYKTVSGTKYTGGWSKVKNVKVK